MAVSGETFLEEISSDCVLINFSGPTRLEYPAPRCPRLVRGRFTTRLYQHWLHNRLEVNQLSRCRCHP